MDFNVVVSVGTGVVLGGAITWFVSWRYYRKAGQELVDQSKKLKLTSDLVLYKLQYPNTPTELKRDEGGDVIGLIVQAKAKR